MAAGAQPSGGRGRGALDPYVPRVLLRHLADEPHAPLRVVEGSAVMADISGFTKLSERLARLGREGAEELVETIDACFTSLLAVAYENGGSLLKFGGDALLLLFDGPDHAARACRSALGMRRRLREAGPIRTTGGQVSLRMSQGVHTGAYHLFLVGGSHRELLVGGPAATAVVAMEQVAGAGEVVMSEATARCLPARCAGAAKGGGVLVAGAPAGEPLPVPHAERMPPLDAVAGCLSTEVRAHVLAGRRPPPEHRTVTVAFVKYGGTDALLEREGPGAVAAALDRVVRAVQEAVDARHVCFLQSDVDADGGKIVLTAGAPRAAGDDEERMLLAVREILDADLPLPVRVGVNRGSVFCGDVGPEYRRTYSTMGDAVNLAARLMAAAPWGECYATPVVLDRSPTAFASALLGPLRVKGKAEPVDAVTLGHPVAARSRDHIVERFPLVGRDRELGVLRAALADATGSPRAGRVVEIAGERGIGKTRLLEELRENAGEVRRLGVACEAYTAVVPYAPWRSLLRQALGLGPDAPAARVLRDLRAAVRRAAPDLVPWLPLLTIPLGIELPPTPEVRELAPRFRAARLHEVTRRLLVALLPVPALLEVEAAHHMDRASADLLGAVTAGLDGVPWLVVVTRRDTGAGLRLPDGAGHVHLEPGPLDPDDTLALAERVTESAPLPPHVVRLAAARSAGNPQFLRDLLRAADA
ncbi:MAG TPA: adenylate/guanylate cyclase domain-containing protein, partial [Solirubrobacteraceae bacterium]|nr:adenylate/guanylate cyclase domain-containing protein [Solirubrobacteraceae bacterium]